MQAIILAAGMGKRLKELTQNNTKCMVRVDGVTLIERMLRQIERQKVSRIIILMKSYFAELKRMIHPTQIKRIWFENRPVSDQTVRSVHVFAFIYLLTTGLGALVLSLDGKDIATNLTASIACISNVGPGLSSVGPTANYAFFSVISKLVLCFEMLLGRLEIFPMLFLLMPGVWKKR